MYVFFFMGEKKTLFKNVHINVSVTKARPPYLSTPKQDWTSTLKKVSASVLEYQIKRPKWHLFIYLFGKKRIVKSNKLSPLLHTF